MNNNEALPKNQTMTETEKARRTEFKEKLSGMYGKFGREITSKQTYLDYWEVICHCSGFQIGLAIEWAKKQPNMPTPWELFKKASSLPIDAVAANRLKAEAEERERTRRERKKQIERPAIDKVQEQLALYESLESESQNEETKAFYRKRIGSMKRRLNELQEKEPNG